MEGTGRFAALERLLGQFKRLLCADGEARLYELTLDAAIHYLEGDHGFILVREGDRPRVRATHNLDRATLSSMRFRPIRKIADHVLSQAEPFLSASVGEDSRFSTSESIYEVPRAVIAVPLRTLDQTLGVLYVDKLHEGEGPFRVEDVRVLQEFGDAAAQTLELASTLWSLEENSTELRRKADELELITHSLQEDVALKSVEIAHFERALDSSARALGEKYTFHNIVGRSPSMRRVFDMLAQVMDYPVPVLVTGESGTGKELVARALHHGGPRKDQPFMAINCAAIPENLLESELFGYKRGAFTGATSDKEGLFLGARRGTVFLDEIGEMPLGIQAKLLRVLQEKEVRPIGGRTSETVEARIVAATNRELREEVEAKRFREDLYYRLNVVEVKIPPLRDRVEDIPDLTEHFLERFGDEFALPNKTLSRAAMQRLMRVEWPGNVRQLENAIKSSAILSRGAVIDVDELRLPDTRLGESGAGVLQAAAAPTAPSPRPITNRAEWEAHDKQRILDALVRCGWNKTRVATELGVSRRNLYRKLARYGIEGEGA